MKNLIAILLALAVVMPAQAQTEDFTGKVFTAKGVVLHQRAGSSAWGVVEAPYLIEAGDRVRTGPEATAEIYIKHGTKVRLGGGTTFLLNNVSKESSAMEVLVGKMQAWVRKAASRRVTVRTPSAVCAIRGTVLDVEVAQDGETVWNLYSGSMQVSNPANTVTRTLAPRQTVTVTKAADISEPAALPAEVKPPSEPKKIKEEKAEIKAEEKAAKEQPKTEAPKEEPKEEVKEEAKTEEAVVEEPPVIAEPVIEPSVIPTQEVQESQAVSGSNP